MSKEALNKPNPVERRLVIVGGASEVLDDALKEFIVEWLVPTLVEEYIRIHSKGPMHGAGHGLDLKAKELNLDAES